MTDEKLNISWDDLSTRRVDNRLREQDAMERNRTYAQMKDDALPEASGSAGGGIWNNAIITMTAFGLLGGLLAWGAGALIAGPLTPPIGAMLHYQPGARANAEAREEEIRQLGYRQATNQLDEAQAETAIEEVKAEGRHNPYFQVDTDPGLSDAGRRIKRADLENADRVAEFVINVVSYGLCGMMIAMCLALAEPLTQRKRRAAWVNGVAGAVAGLCGGIAAALLTDRISQFAGAFTASQASWVRQLALQSAIWGTLGAFLGLGSGVTLRSVKKIGVGIVGGLLGGLIGGALFDSMQNVAGNAQLGRLVALVAIGMVAGLATGLLENAIKAGWLKVTSGIIAGKQFILYRNPTYIGSSPDCQIYLFKDPQVGRRHAAIHLLPGGIEIEDLPLGGATRVNGKPITRGRLKNGDTIQVGETSFQFQEKRPVAGR